MSWMLDNGNKIVFVHIPKTGGTNISNHVKRFPTPFKGGGRRMRGGHKRFIDVGRPDYTCISFCRNPYDRFISIFHYFNGRGFKHFRGIGQLGFEDYVGHACESDHQFFQPMVWWIEGAKDLRVYRFEDYENEYKRLLSDYGLPVTSPPHYRRSKGRQPVDAYYTPELKEKIYLKYKEDFEFFNYAKET